MKFCPKCEKRMKPRIEEGILSCPKCGLIAQREDKSEGKVNLIRDAPGSLKILEAEKELDALPTTSIDCSRCGNDMAFWWMLQNYASKFNIFPFKKFMLYDVHHRNVFVL